MPAEERTEREALGPTCLLASGRVGRRVATNRSDRDVYVDSTGHNVCCHGEREATIAAWRFRERSESGFKRPSLCDCVNTDGLCTDYGVPQSEWPALPDKQPLYKVLGDLGAEQITCGGRPQRLAFRTHTSETWVRPSGGLVCKHGHSRRVLGSIRKGKPIYGTACACALVAVPRRENTVFSCLLATRRAHAAKTKAAAADAAAAAVATADAA